MFPVEGKSEKNNLQGWLGLTKNKIICARDAQRRDFFFFLFSDVKGVCTRVSLNCLPRLPPPLIP